MVGRPSLSSSQVWQRILAAKHSAPAPNTGQDGDTGGALLESQPGPQEQTEGVADASSDDQPQAMSQLLSQVQQQLQSMGETAQYQLPQIQQPASVSNALSGYQSPYTPRPQPRPKPQPQFHPQQQNVQNDSGGYQPRFQQSMGMGTMLSGYQPQAHPHFPMQQHNFGNAPVANVSQAQQPVWEGGIAPGYVSQPQQQTTGNVLGGYQPHLQQNQDASNSLPAYHLQQNQGAGNNLPVYHLQQNQPAVNSLPAKHLQQNQGVGSNLSAYHLRQNQDVGNNLEGYQSSMYQRNVGHAAPWAQMPQPSHLVGAGFLPWERQPSLHRGGETSNMSLGIQPQVRQQGGFGDASSDQLPQLQPRDSGNASDQNQAQKHHFHSLRPPPSQVEDANNMMLDDQLQGQIQAGDDLLDMQNSLSITTFEDSVRSFVNAKGQLKSALAEVAARTLKPRKIAKRGPRKAAEPTGDVKMRLNLATKAYLEGSLDQALEYVNDAIRINAEIHRAWSLLAQIHQDKGNSKESLLASVCAAHLQPKILEGWMSCSFTAVELMEELPDDVDDLSRIAISTFSQAIQVDPTNMVARQGRAALLLSRDNYRSAFAQYAYLVERNPVDVHALRGFAEAACKLAEHARKDESEGKPEAARDAYRRCVEHCRANGIDPDLPFEWDDAIIYVELLTDLRQFEDAIKETKSIARWLLGREEEKYWDDVDDDREWDDDDERRVKVDDFIPDKYPASKYGAGLPSQLRTKLIVCRLRLHHEEEAKHHMEWLDPMDESSSDVKAENPELFLEVASTLFDTSRSELALRFYEPLRSMDDILDANALYQAGKCYLTTGDKRQAEECFTAAIDSDDSNIDARINARYELAKMYEAARHEEEAYIMLTEAMNLEDDRDAESGEGLSIEGKLRAGVNTKSIAKPRGKPKRATYNPEIRPRKPRQPRPVKHKDPRMPREPNNTGQRRRPMVFALDEEKKKEEEKRSEHMANLWDNVRKVPNESPQGGPSDVWMDAASELLDDFRSFKAFYPWDRYLIHMGLRQDRAGPSSTNPTLLKMAERLRDNLNPLQPVSIKRADEITVSYRDVGWQEWLDLFIEYAMSIALIGQIKDAYSVLEAARDANVFNDNPEDMFLLHVAIAAVAIRGRDEEKCVDVARFFMSRNLFASDAFRMYAALCRLCSSTAAWFADTRVQKFILRQVKFMDSSLLPPDEKDKPLDGFDPTHYPYKDLHMPLLMLYGHILFISNSFTYALNYFVRAYAIDPDDIMINISIGQAYLHYALKRQAENRQHLIVQGFAFLHKYYEGRLRVATTAAQRQEAHYNLARSYHAVGISHLAVEYYRRVFREVEGRGAEETGDENLAREAAFNLQQLCFIGGDMEAARAVTEKWLVL